MLPVDLPRHVLVTSSPHGGFRQELSLPALWWYIQPLCLEQVTNEIEFLFSLQWILIAWI